MGECRSLSGAGKVVIRSSRWGRASSNWLRRAKVRMMCVVSVVVGVIHCEERVERVLDRSCASGWMERTLRTALSVEAPMPILSRSISVKIG